MTFSLVNAKIVKYEAYIIAYFHLVYKSKERKTIKLIRNGSVLLTNEYLNVSDDIKTETQNILLPTKNLLDSLYQVQFSSELPILCYYSINKFSRSEFSGKVATYLSFKSSGDIYLTNLSLDKSSVCRYEIVYLNRDGRSDTLKCYGGPCVNLCGDIENISVPSSGIDKDKIVVKVTTNNYGITYERNYLSYYFWSEYCKN